MVALRLDDNEHTFLILDDQGRSIGRVHHTAYPLDLRPPEDTVFLAPEPPRWPDPRSASARLWAAARRHREVDDGGSTAEM